MVLLRLFLLQNREKRERNTCLVSCNVTVESNGDAWTEMKGFGKIEFLIFFFFFFFIYIEEYTVRKNIFES